MLIGRKSEVKNITMRGSHYILKNSSMTHKGILKLRSM